MLHNLRRRRGFRLLTWTTLALTGLRSHTERFLQGVSAHKKPQSSCKNTPSTQTSGRKNPKSRRRSAPFWLQEHLPPRQPQTLPRSLMEMNPEQLELALLVVDSRLWHHPPPLLSQLRPCDWVSLISLWEQLRHQRQNSPLH